LQENLDDFLHRGLGITHYDRLYAPGGGGALATSADGPAEAVCGDYVRKMPGATAHDLREQQNKDAAILKRLDWGAGVALHTYRCEVRGDHRIQFVAI
jgi:hypothetical protein